MEPDSAIVSHKTTISASGNSAVRTDTGTTEPTWQLTSADASGAAGSAACKQDGFKVCVTMASLELQRHHAHCHNISRDEAQQPLPSESLQVSSMYGGSCTC